MTAGDDNPQTPNSRTPQTARSSGTPQTPRNSGTPQTPENPGTPQTPRNSGTPQAHRNSGTPQAPPDARTAKPSAVVRVGSPAALLAVVPHLLGFVPDASVVVIGLTPPRDRVRVTLRYDLPEPSNEEIIADIVAHAVGVIGSQRLAAAVAVGYGPETLVTPVADALRDAALEAGIDLYDILRVEDGRYWSYRCGDEACCPAAGVPFDPAAHPAAADMVTAGKQVLADRAAVAVRVAPIGYIAAESMRQATRRAEQHVAQLLAKVRRSSRIGAARHMIAAEGLATVGEMIARYRGGGRFTSDYEIARITVALRDLRVRDDAWARMDPAHAEAHLRLWTDVVRRAQPGHVTAPAALLAFVAWQSGDGALANVALDRALADDPTYSMALLLRQVINAGAPPSLARLPMTPEEVAASYDDAEGEAFSDGEDDPDHDRDLGTDDQDPDLDQEG
jgi:Domain of unknown function (DUF4192)